MDTFCYFPDPLLDLFSGSVFYTACGSPCDRGLQLPGSCPGPLCDSRLLHSSFANLSWFSKSETFVSA